MFLRDLIVAIIAAGLGLSMIRVAANNQGWWFENFIVRNIESSRGRSAARKSLFVGGLLMVLVGLWTLVVPWLKKEVVTQSLLEFDPCRLSLRGCESIANQSESFSRLGDSRGSVGKAPGLKLHRVGTAGAVTQAANEFAACERKMRW